jgi:ABC-type Na+ efflux pump permease subunit
MNIPKNYNKHLVAASIAIKIFILPYFLFTPSMISAVLSADSFAGEKQRKTMESLALLPISKNELILGKVLVAFIPSVLLSFIFFVFLGIEINLIMFEHLDGNILLFTDIIWLLTIFLLVPAITLFNIIIMVIISSRTKSFKGAQTISGLLITPIIIIMFMQTFNPAFLSSIMIIILSCIMIGICMLLIKIGKRYVDIEKLIIIV